MLLIYSAYHHLKKVLSVHQQGQQAIQDEEQWLKKINLKIIKKNNVTCWINVDAVPVETSIIVDGWYNTEIRTRIWGAKSTFSSFRTVVCFHQNKLGLKLLKCCLWLIFLYRCEHWTVKKDTEYYWFRKSLKISWLAKMQSNKMLQRIGHAREQLDSIVGQRKLWLHGGLVICQSFRDSLLPLLL